MTCYWPYAVRSSNTSVCFFQACLRVPAIGSFKKKKEKHAVFLYTETHVTILDSFEGLCLVVTRFRHY